MKMSPICFVLLFLVLSTSVFLSCQKKSLENKIPMKNINDIPFQSYIGKEVYNLLLDDKIRTYQTFRFFDNKPGLLNGAIITINEGIYLEIYVNNYLYVKQFTEERDWDKSLFYKETISRIKVFKNHECVLETK